MSSTETMRDMMNLVSEGEVVSLGQHKLDKAVGTYGDALRGIIAQMAQMYAPGTKFMPLALTYIESGFKYEKMPELLIDVTFRDYRKSPAAKALVIELKRRGFEIIPGTKPSKRWNSPGNGGFARKDELDFEQAKAIFASRANSPFGAYQTSKHGFGQDHNDTFDENGIGFKIMVTGYDNRRGSKVSKDDHDRCDIIDDERDMKEVVDMFAAVRRARMAVV